MKRTLALLLAIGMAVFGLTGCDQFVARTWGGTVHYNLPAGAQLLSMTWKGTDLWVLYYQPATRTCVFAENTSSGMMEGQVIIKDCNPLTVTPSVTVPAPAPRANHG